MMKRFIAACSNVEYLRDALDYAYTVIEAYQSDLRNSDDPRIGLGPINGKTLEELGFCQGSIYRDALPRIERVLDGTSVGH